MFASCTALFAEPYDGVVANDSRVWPAKSPTAAARTRLTQETDDLAMAIGRIRSDRRHLICAKMGVTMKVTIDLPEDVSTALGGRWDDVPRRSLETIAVEGYRIGALTETQVRRLLQLETRFQVHALLKEHRVPLRYTEVDLEDDLRAHRELGVLPGR